MTSEERAELLEDLETFYEALKDAGRMRLALRARTHLNRLENEDAEHDEGVGDVPSLRRVIEAIDEEENR